MPDANPKTPKTAIKTTTSLSKKLLEILSTVIWHFDTTKKVNETIYGDIIDSWHPKTVSQFDLLFDNANDIMRLRLANAIADVYKAKNQVRLPVQHKYVEIYDNQEHINWDSFWAEFDLVNNVTPVDPSSSQTETSLREVADEIRIFRESATPRLQAALNEYLSEIAQTQKPEGASRRTADLLPYEQKQLIVNLVNSNIEQLGVAIKYKGNPCYLTCLKGTAEGRFALVPKGGKSALLARSNLSDFLPLELMDATRPPEVPEYAQQVLDRRNRGKAERE